MLPRKFPLVGRDSRRGRGLLRASGTAFINSPLTRAYPALCSFDIDEGLEADAGQSVAKERANHALESGHGNPSS